MFEHYTRAGDVAQDICLDAGTYRVVLSRAHAHSASVALSHADPGGGGARLIDVAIGFDGMTERSVLDLEATADLARGCYTVRLFNAQAALAGESGSVGVRIFRSDVP